MQASFISETEAFCTRRRQCKRRTCAKCRRWAFKREVRSTIAAWQETYGSSCRVLQVTLTMQPCAGRTAAEWMEHTRRQWDRYRKKVSRSLGKMPEYILAKEWTALGTPHLHIAVPVHGSGMLEARILEAEWQKIEGFADARMKTAKDGLAYVMKSLQWATGADCPAGTPKYKRIVRSQGCPRGVIGRESRFRGTDGKPFCVIGWARLRGKLRYWRKQAKQRWWDSDAVHKVLTLSAEVAEWRKRRPVEWDRGPVVLQMLGGKMARMYGRLF